MKNFGIEDGNDTRSISLRYRYSFINTGLQAGGFWCQAPVSRLKRLLAARLDFSEGKAVETQILH